MSTFTEGNHYSAKSAANADLSTKKGYCVKTDNNGKIVLASAATDKILGVLADGGRVAGDNVDVVLINGSGTYKAIAAGAISKDAYITSDSAGKVVSTTTTGNHVIGQAMQAATGDGQQIEYLKKDFIHV
jgi:hypothetical protein